MSLKIRIDSQKLYAIILVYMLSFLGLLSLINEVLNIVGLNTVLDTVLIYGILYFLLIIGSVFLLFKIKHLSIDVILFFTLMLVLYTCSFVLEENRTYLFSSIMDYAKNPMYYIFIYSLPGYIFSRQLVEYDYFSIVAKRFSYGIVIFSIIVFFFSRESSAAQYMTFSYNMIFHLLFLLFNKPQKYKLFHQLVVLFGLFVFFLGGSRGALISFILILVLAYILYGESNSKKIVIGVSSIILLAIIWMNRDRLLGIISSLLKTMSIESRNFNEIIKGTLFEDESRKNIYHFLLNNVNLFGHGMMGDRVLLHGSYAHNLFLEWLIDFGMFGGIIISVSFFILLYRGIKYSKKEELIYILILLPNGLFQLMLSGSYLHQVPALFVLMGFCYNSISRRKYRESVVNK